MKTVTGIFTSRADAEQAVERIRTIALPDKYISLLTPGTSPEQIDAAVPTTETEQPGMGSALGGTVGGALGVAGGMHLGAAVASLFVPGVGPIFAAGILGAALLGIGGAAAGAKTGEAMEDSIAPELPHDELYVYEDALRQGRSVVIVAAKDEEQADAAREILGQAGAESVDAARENWWVGLRDAEESEYAKEGRDFKQDEAHYRRGFEAALNPRARGKSYQDATDYLRERHGDAYTNEGFQRGYERGQGYYQSLEEKYKG
ncbi:MAG TPA: hypothetical protein VGO91_09640 [Pyrinomonadaceae bacterium]|jgi:hypothetical protein|nr:hypothetical protein [Pyrinomonadaceae bacterium]